MHQHKVSALPSVYYMTANVHVDSGNTSQLTDITNFSCHWLNFPPPRSSRRLQILIHLPHSLLGDQKGRQRQPNIHHDQSETYVSLQYPFSDTRLQDFLCSSAPNPTLCPVLQSATSEEKHTRQGWMSNAINPKSIQHFTFSFYLSSQGDFN